MKKIIAILETETSFICETLESNENNDGVNHLVELSKETVSGVSKFSTPSIDIDEFKSLSFEQKGGEGWEAKSLAVSELLKGSIIASAEFLCNF